MNITVNGVYIVERKILMIDRIYFFGNKYVNEKDIDIINEMAVLYTPHEGGKIKLKDASTLVGKEILKLFEFYDIVYLDVRFLNTTDFGMGFLSEFGFKFFDKNDNELKPLGLNVYYIDRLEVPEIISDRNKKIRLILDRPLNNPYKGRKCSRISTGALEYELMKRSFLNLQNRLKNSGLNVRADLEAADAGGFSTIISTLLGTGEIEYFTILDEVFEKFYTQNINVNRVSIEEVFERMSETHDYKEKALKLHEDYKGKIKVESKYPLTKKDDLALLYTPGVAEPCKKIAENKEDVYKYTAKGNLVAVVTDGSAVLGLGNIGAEAGMPVMEGKSILFKHFGNVDAFPILVDSQDTEKIIETVKMIAPTFGGINLEDIAAPRCFEIERRLVEELDIPVFHDDQHGTAIVVTAGVINALKVVGKKAEDVKVVINGCGAAGVAILKMMRGLGVKHILILDSKGIVYRGNERNNWLKNEVAEITNENNEKGTLADAMKGADIFIGVSVAGAVTKEMVKSMNKDAIIFAMANPVPEIYPDEAKEAGAKVVGTGRSDFPNQINNVLCFPGLFRGALDARAKRITPEMNMAAAHAIADIVGDELDADHVIPDPMDMTIPEKVAEAVKKIANENK